MQCWEQQINNQLTKAEEQQELNFIRWQLSNSTKKSFFLPRPKNQGISQWVERLPPDLSPRKKRLISLLTKKNTKNSSYVYALEALDQEQGQKFLKYANKTPFYSVKKEVFKGTSPKRINLKLPMPHFLEIDTDSKQTQYHQSSLPIIKKLTIPIRNLRNIEKRKDKPADDPLAYPLLFRDSEKEYGGPESYRKGRMLGTTRRLFKNSNAYPRTERPSMNCSELEGCLTLRK